MANFKWSREQLDSIKTSGKSILVSAAAGSGKTAVLVERIIRKITGENPVDIDKLVIVTFTKAAASEMKERLSKAINKRIEALSKVSSDKKENEKIQGLNEEDIEKINSLDDFKREEYINLEIKNLLKQNSLISKSNISTIDSFCSKILNENAHLVNISKGYRVANNNELDLIKQEAIEKTLEEYYKNDDIEFLDLVDNTTNKKSDDELKNIILKLYSFAQASLDPIFYVKDAVKKYDIRKEDFESSKIVERIRQISIDTVSEAKDLVSLASVTLDKIDTNELNEKQFIFVNRFKKLIRNHKIIINELLETVKNKSFDEIRNFFIEKSEDDDRVDEKGKRIAVEERYPNLKFSLFVGKTQDFNEKEFIKLLVYQYKDYITKLKDKFFTYDSETNIKLMQKMTTSLYKLNEVYNSFYNNFTLSKRSRNILDFSDIEHLALKILVDIKEVEGQLTLEKTEIAKAYSEVFHEILIDEYQDSNYVQEAILKSVSKDANNIFMVGDVKQSIYKFRQAKPELFIEKSSRYLSLDDVNAYSDDNDGIKILLHENYRFRNEVIDAVNDIFFGIMSRESSSIEYDENEKLIYSAGFYKNEVKEKFLDEFGNETKEFRMVSVPDDKKIEIPDKNLNNIPLEVHLIENKEEVNKVVSSQSEDSIDSNEVDGYDGAEEESLHAHELEAKYIAEKIKELVEYKSNAEKEAYLVYDKDKNIYRNLEYKDIVILLRSPNKYSKIYVEALSEKSIEAFADTTNGYFEAIEIRTIMSLLQIIDNRRQDIPLLAVLRSPIYNFNEDEFVILKTEKYNKTSQNFIDYLLYFIEKYEKTEDDFTNDYEEKIKLLYKVKSFINTLDRFRDLSTHMRVDEFIWMLYKETGYYDFVGAMPNGVQRQANLKILFQKAFDYESTSFKGLYNFINYMSSVRDRFNTDVGDAKILGESENVVRLMSIHKSKGLEFPIVFLAGASSKFNMLDARHKLVLNEDLGVGIGYFDEEKSVSAKTLPQIVISEKIKDETLAEEMRILYVALTRAREKLFITAPIDNAREKLIEWSNVVSFDEDLRMSTIKTLDAKNYLDWIMPNLIKRNVHNKKFSMYVEQFSMEDKFTFGDNDSFIINIIPNEEVVKDVKESREIRFNSLYDENVKISSDLKKVLDYEYKYIDSTKLPTKTSVSAIKKRYMEENGVLKTYDGKSLNSTSKDVENEEIIINEKTIINDNKNGKIKKSKIKLNIKKPSFLEEVKGLDASEKGTAFHNVMFHINPLVANIDDIEKEKDRMVKSELITSEEAKETDSNEILNFLKSNLGREFIGAYIDKRLFKEEKFYQSMKASEAFKDVEAQDEVTIIGIIDAFFFNKDLDEITLIDYKTDKINDINELELKYRAQIELYAKAIYNITNVKVKHAFLYSTKKNESLELILE